MLEAGERRTPVVPPALLAQARLDARDGVPLDTVLRRYFAGNALFGGCCGAPTNVIVRNNTIKNGSYLYGAIVAMGTNTIQCNKLDNGELAVYFDTDRMTNAKRNAC